MSDLQKEWMSGKLEMAGSLPGEKPKVSEKAAKAIIREVLLFLLKLPQDEIRGKQIDWLNNIATFADKHEIEL